MLKLIHGVHKFQQEVFGGQKELFERLADRQSPHTLFITCADSRINPNLLTQSNPGEIFILRNAGNIIPSYGAPIGGEAATIEYAVTALEVEHIVVCGHSDCGAMKAILDPKRAEKMPAVRTWLNHAETTRRIIEENYPDREGPARMNTAIQENVLAQIENLRTHPSVAARTAKGSLRIHAWIYQIETGEVFSYDPAEGQFLSITKQADETPMPRASFTTKAALPEVLTANDY